MTMTEDSKLEDRLLLKTRPIGQSLGGVTLEHDPDCVEAARLIASLRGRVEELTRELHELALHTFDSGTPISSWKSRALAAEAKAGELEAERARWERLAEEAWRKGDEAFLHSIQANAAAAAAEAKVERLERALKPFAAADRAIGDEPGPFRFETRNGHRLIEREHLREAARALSQEVKP